MKSGRRIVNMIMVFLLVLQLGVIIPGVTARDMTIEITEYSVSNDLIAPGDQFTLDMVVKNNSNEKITGLYTEVEDSSGFSLTGMDSKIRVSAFLDPGASASVSISMFYQGGGDGQVPLSFSYIKDGYTNQITEERYLTVKLKDSSSSKTIDGYLPILKIENKETLYTSAGSQLQAEINIQNISSYSARELLINASFAQDAPFSFPAEQLYYFRTLGSGESKTVNLNILTSENAVKGTYIMKIDYQFTDISGESYTAYENVYVRVDNAKAPPSLVFVPQLDESEYMVSGEDFILLITAKNQGQLSARDISISLDGLSSAGISLSSGSSRQYLDDLEAGTEGEITYMIKAAPDLPDDSYPIILKAVYTDQTGAAYSTELEIMLRVSSEAVSGNDQEGTGYSSVEIADTSLQELSRLEVGNIRFTGDMKPGELVNVYCTYYNIGKNKLTNLIIKIDGDFEATDETVFVGDMEHDSSGYFHGTFKPLKAGEITGRLVFSYQDQSGEPLVLTEPFSMNIAGETSASAADNYQQDNKVLGWWYIVIPILVITGAATASLQIQRKKQPDKELEDE